MKSIFSIVTGLLLLVISTANAKQVAYCKTHNLGAKTTLKCTGHFEGQSTLVHMYEDGWELKIQITEAVEGSGFILIFDK